MSASTKILLPILATLVFTGVLLCSGLLTKSLTIEFSANTYLNQQGKHQLVLLVITGLSLLCSFAFNKSNFATYFSFGQPSAVAQELKLFGINKGDTWLKTGVSLCLIISAATGLFMYFQLKKINPDWSVLPSGLFWIVLFSLTNSFGEEMIYRLGIVSPLNGLLAPTTVFLLSAVLFGLPHFAGMPNGILGATMAGLLGFVLAKSMLETHGFFWAWLIHFLQDVLIIGSLFLMNTVSGTAR